LVEYFAGRTAGHSEVKVGPVWSNHWNGRIHDWEWNWPPRQVGPPKGHKAIAAYLFVKKYYYNRYLKYL